MRKFLVLLLSIVSVAGYAQTTMFGGIGLRVNDTTTYQTNAAAAHAAGAWDIYFNNQATTKHWDVWNGSSYDHVFDFIGDGDATTASNGLTESGNDIKLGGSLTGNTSVAGGGFDLIFTGTDLFSVTPGTGGAINFETDGATLFMTAFGGDIEIATDGLYTASGDDILFSAGTGDQTFVAADDIRLNPADDLQLNNVSGTTGQVISNTDGHAEWVSLSSLGSSTVNIYTTDGTLTGNRALSGGGNSLALNSLSTFDIAATGAYTLTSSGGGFSLTTSAGTQSFAAADINLSTTDDINIDADDDLLIDAISGSTGQVISNTNGHPEWVDLADISLTKNFTWITKTTNYTPVATDTLFNDPAFNMRSASATSFTIPSYLTTNFEQGTTFLVYNDSTGTVTIDLVSGVVAESTATPPYTLEEDEYAVVSKSNTTQTWKIMMGNPAAAGGENIYNTDGTLTANRTLTGGGFDLTFDGIDVFGVNSNANTLYAIGATTIQGDGNIAITTLSGDDVNVTSNDDVLFTVTDDFTISAAGTVSIPTGNITTAGTSSVDLSSGTIGGTITGAISFIAGSTANFSTVSGFTAEAAPLINYRNDASNNTVLASFFRVRRESSTTPALGIGARIIEGVIETASGNNETMGHIELVTTDVGSATEDADFVFNLMQNGAAANEKFRIRSNGSFSYGSTANSPTVSVTYATSGGFAVHRYISQTTNVFDVGGESLGVYGGTPNNVSGANLIWYDDQASAYRMGLNASGDFFVGASNTNYGLSITQAGALQVGRKSTGPGEIRIGEDSDNGSNYAGFTVNSTLAGNTIYTLPTAFPSVSNSALISNTSGTTSWMPTVLNGDYSQVGNVTTGEDQLFSYTLPASTLATDGNSVIVQFSGTRAANGNAKTIKAKFGANVYSSVSTSGTWVITCEYVRTGAATQKGYCITQDSGGTETHSGWFAATETLSGTVAIVLTGEATATNDIVKEYAKVRFEP